MKKKLNLIHATTKIADAINRKRRQEIFEIYNQKTVFSEYIRQARESGQFQKGNKSKSMRKVASLPMEVDQFFSKVYGKDYYKDTNFFNKHHPEWLVIDPLKVKS